MPQNMAHIAQACPTPERVGSAPGLRAEDNPRGAQASPMAGIKLLRSIANRHRFAIPPPPLPRTNRTSLVPPLVLSGHAAWSCEPFACCRHDRSIEQNLLIQGRSRTANLSTIAVVPLGYKSEAYPEQKNDPNLTDNPRLRFAPRAAAALQHGGAPGHHRPARARLCDPEGTAGVGRRSTCLSLT